MRLNNLHGTVADRPVNAQVVRRTEQRNPEQTNQDDSVINRMRSVLFGFDDDPEVINLASLPDYDKGR